MSTTQILKLELMEWLAIVQSKSIIAELAQWKGDHQRISIEQYNKELDEADAEMDRGEFYTQKEAEKRIRSWRGNWYGISVLLIHSPTFW